MDKETRDYISQGPTNLVSVNVRLPYSYDVFLCPVKGSELDSEAARALLKLRF